MSSNNVSSNSQILFGFHAIGMRLKLAPASVLELHIESGRQDRRMHECLARAKAAGVRIVESDKAQLFALCASLRHQGLVARVQALPQSHSLDDTLDTYLPQSLMLLVLDGVTDPHNLGACLRVADAAGVQAVIAPKDHAVGLNATVSKVASGAAQTVPYFRVTNLSRTLTELKERDILVIGTAEDARESVFEVDLSGPIALVVGSEGGGMRQLTRKRCDQLVHLPMCGVVESLNVSVAAGICLFEAYRQRQAALVA